MTRLDSKIGDPIGSNRKGQYRRAWKESHGGWLLSFAAVILVLGLLCMWMFPPQKNDQMSDALEILETEETMKLPPNVLVVRVVSTMLQDSGPIRIAIYDSEESFGQPEQAVLKDSLFPVDGFVVWEMSLDILPDRFAIAAYHDLDDNGELNRALFNAPVEPYGFSNDARNLAGPPTFAETLISRPTSSQYIELRVY